MLSGSLTRCTGQDWKSTNSHYPDYPPIGCITLDSNQFKAIELLIIDNNTLKNVNKKLIENTELYRANETLFRSRSDSLLKIIDLKEEQITGLEKIPRVAVTEHSWKWWQYTLAAIGAAGAGFTAGIIFENITK
jgi:hypothetical protein